ncbi:MAG: ribbon-helix-helix domain-containing protein [Halobacteriaceae archaeon]
MAQRGDPSRVRCSFHCRPELIDRIDRLARENNVDRSEAVRQLVTIGLDEVNSGTSE